MQMKFNKTLNKLLQNIGKEIHPCSQIEVVSGIGNSGNRSKFSKSCSRMYFVHKVDYGMKCGTMERGEYPSTNSVGEFFARGGGSSPNHGEVRPR